MIKKALLLLIFISISLILVSCAGDFLENELKLKSSRRTKGAVSTITVTADAVGKNSAEADPPLTYTYDPDPLPDGVSITGSLARDAGELVGTYVIRLGTLKLTGSNASKYTLKYIGGIFSIYSD